VLAPCIIAFKLNDRCPLQGLTCTVGPGTRPGLTSMSRARETFPSTRRESPGRVQISSRLVSCRTLHPPISLSVAAWSSQNAARTQNLLESQRVRYIKRIAVDQTVSQSSGVKILCDLRYPCFLKKRNWTLRWRLRVG
jgi:hypothetical protein